MPAIDPPAATAPAAAELTAPAMLALAERLAGEGRRADAARLLAALTADPDGDVRAEARFRLGMLRAADRDWAGAAAAFRALLAERPDAPRVRLELARVLAEQGDDAGARRQIRQAQAGGLPDDVARTVDRFQTALRARRRLGASIEAGIAPDSNINRANRDATIAVGPAVVTLDRDAQARSGVGATVAAQGFWRPRLAVDLDALATVSVNADLYKADRFNDVAVTGMVGPELTRGRTRYRVQAIAGRRWFGGRGYSRTLGAGATLLRPIGRRAQLQVDLSALDVDYAVNDAQDGRLFSAQLRYDRALTSRLSMRISLLGQRQDAAAPAFATWTGGGQVLLSRDLGPLALYASAGWYRTEGDAAFLFPPVARDDDLVTLEGGIVFRRLAVGGLAPVLRIQRTLNNSPVFFYDFAQTRVTMALTREF